MLHMRCSEAGVVLTLTCLLSLGCGLSVQRTAFDLPERNARQLLTVSYSATGSNATATIQVVAAADSNASSHCIFQGYPGSTDDSEEPGPLIVDVPVGTTANISFGPLTNGAIVALYNQTNNATLKTAYNETYGLINVTFSANDSTAVGQSAYITAGRVEEYNNSIPERSWGSSPSCFVNVTFVVVPYVAPSPPPPPPKGFLSGLFGNGPDLKPPCFCTPIVARKSTCFNFIKASSDVDCQPMGGLECTSTQADPGLFTEEGGPVYDCELKDSPATAG